ncbi:MAG TPA: hypothetical protein VNF68_10200, partial [Candidatus Baltobacteraceae bacterium]|nr:hypothetical protein [Candidatus Baltobacteraceae bacterium]
YVTPAPPAQPGAVSFVAIGPTNMTDGGIPSSGKVNAFAVDPTNPSTIYLAGGRGTGLETYTSSGVYRTTNGGQSWQPFDDGLTDAAGVISSVVNALWIDPQHPSDVLAATDGDGIFLSSDGSTWHNVLRTTLATQFAAYGGSVFAATGSGIVVSSDGGNTWGTSLSNVQATTVASSAGALYAGMTDGEIYSFANGTWSHVGTIPFNAATGTDASSPAIHQIAVDPLTPTTLYALNNDGSWDQGLETSTDGGHTWSAVTGGSAQIGLGPQAIAFSQNSPHLLYIGADGAFFSIPGDGSTSPTPIYANVLSVIDVRNIWVAATPSGEACWVASDQGLDRVASCYSAVTPNDAIVSAPIAMGLARRIAISPDGTLMLVSLQDFDDHVTFDGGTSWHEQPSLYEDGFDELRPGNVNACYHYDETGFYASSDGCHTFPSQPAAGVTITSERTMTEPIAFDPSNALHMYVTSGSDPAASANFVTGPTGVYETYDGGATFARLAWPFTLPGSVCVDQVNAKHLIVGDRAGGIATLSVSFDGGATWTKSSGVPSSPFWYAVTMSPVDGQTILATSADASNNVFVIRSTDGGRTFTAGPTVLAHARRLNGYRSKAERVGYFAFSPVREIRFNQDVHLGVPAAVLTTINGAFLSADNGLSWQRVDKQTIAHSFWGTRWANGYLYLASDGQGVLRSTSAVQAP